MFEPSKVVGIVGYIGPYDLKSMEWSTYKNRFMFCLETNNINDAALKLTTFVILIGDKAYRMLADLHLPDDLSTVNFDTLFTDLNSAYCKKVSKLASRVRFQSIVQHEGQSVNEYFADLRHSSIDCGFGDQLDNRINDHFDVGLRSDQIKKLILEDKDKALADIVKKARDLELVNRVSTSSKSAPTSAFSTHQVPSRVKIKLDSFHVVFNLSHLSRRDFRLRNHRPITVSVCPVIVVVRSDTNLTNVVTS